MAMERAVAGYRVLRQLARGERSTVLLAPDNVVLKVLNASALAGSVVGQPGLEAEALHRAAGEHVVPLLDVSVDAEGAVLVFPRLPRGSLAELLARRSTLDAGEAVTILAPLAASIARMHAAGVAHTALTPGCVLFSGDGAPTLTGFGSSELFEPGLAEVRLETIAGVVADRIALSAVADAVLSRVAGGRSKAAARLREELFATPLEQLTTRLSGELFDVAAARAISFDADRTDAAAGAARMVPVADRFTVDEPKPEPNPFAGIAGRLLAVGPGPLVGHELRERWASWSATKRRAMISIGAATLALLIAVAVVPGPPTTETVSGVVSAAQDPADLTESDLAESTDDKAIEGDDPIAALIELVKRREQCFQDLSVLCLEGVDEPGSSAFDTDRSLLDGGSGPHLELESPTLIERLGDSALIELGAHSDPASVLLLKGETGWRIRDYLAPPEGAVP